MFTVCVREHFMIAHSFSGSVFGPAQKMHGATYVVDMELRRAALDEHGIVVDIGLATETLRTVLADLNFRNLDEAQEFAGRNTTTEFLSLVIFERVRERIAQGEMGAGAKQLHSMRVVLHESHVAWAAYEDQLTGSI